MRNKFSRTVILLFLLLLASSCAPSPTTVADAHKTTVEADQAALDQEQAREQARMKFAREQAVWEAAQAEFVKTVNLIVRYGGLTLVATLCFVIIRTGQGVGMAAQGLGEAVKIYAVTRAEVAANLIHLDVKTRTYPMLRHVHGSRYALADPNGKAVMMLDSDKPGDKLALLMLGLTQHDGAVAYEARLHKEDPTGVSMGNQIGAVMEAAKGLLVDAEVSYE